MAAPQPASLSPQQGLSIYRRLLRACSYLPPAVRPTIQASIRTRFHQHRKYDPRAQQHWARAERTLRTLTAANNGHGKSMEGLIAKAFGRSGIRRRQLMSEFVVPRGVPDSKSLEALTRATEEANTSISTKGEQKGKKIIGNPKNRFFLKWDQPKLLRLLSSMRKRQNDERGASHLLGPTIKASNPDVDVPEKNIWGDPPAECVANAKRARWWRRTADKMEPPLGKGEWELLGRLSRGAQDSGEWQIPARRAPVGAAAKAPAENDEAAASLMRYASRSPAVVEKSTSRKRMPRSGRQDPGPYGPSHSGPGLSPRWFRRAYNRVWVVTPKMEQDPKSLQYKFTFGDLPGRHLRAATPRQQSIFDGVDAEGKPLQQNSTK